MPFAECRSRETGELYLSPEGRWAVIRTGKDQLQLWDIDAAQPVRTLAPSADRIPAVAVTDDLRVLAPRIVNRSARLVDLTTGTELCSLDETRMNEAAVFSAGGLRLAASAIGYGDEPLGVWDTATGDLLFSSSSSYSVMDLSPCGEFLAVKGPQGSVLLWEIANRIAKPRELRREGQPVNAIAMTAHASWVAAGSRDGTVAIWHNRKAEVQQEFTGHEEAVNCLAITPGGRLIFSGSRDRTARVWLRGQSHPLDVFAAEAAVVACGISPEGHGCLVRDANGTIYFLRR